MRTVDAAVIGTCMLCRKPVIGAEPHAVCQCVHPLTNHTWHEQCASAEAERRGLTIQSTCATCKAVMRTEDTSWLPGDTWSAWSARFTTRWSIRAAMLLVVLFSEAFIAGYCYKLCVSANSVWHGRGIPREFALWGIQSNSTLHAGWYPGRKHLTLGLWLGYKLLIFAVLLYAVWLLARLLVFPPLRWFFSLVRSAAFGPRYRSVVIKRA